MKIATPLKKVNLSFPATPLKVEILSSPHFFNPTIPRSRKVGGGGRGGGACTLFKYHVLL